MNDAILQPWESDIASEQRVTRSRARQRQQEAEAGEDVNLIKNALAIHFSEEQSMAVAAVVSSSAD